MQLGPVGAQYRPRVAGLLAMVSAFNEEERAVALELFDLATDTARGAKDARADYETLGAFSDGTLCGYACFGPTPSTDGTYDLYWLVVDPASQKSGVGRSLLRGVEQLLARRGARLLVVETSSRDEYSGTRAFYARGGYTEAARVRDFYAPSDDRITLTTRLTANDGGVATR